jgi:spore germination cell wall hydrolase CwlJ-like protein
MTNRLLIAMGVVIVLLFIRINDKMDELANNSKDLSQRIDNIEKIIQTKDAMAYTKRDLDCLTKNIYYEAGVEADPGKYAVAHVTLNRVKSGYWGNDICKVVYSPKQFSWTTKKRLPKPNPILWAKCQDIAKQTLHGTRVSGLGRSLYYHADYIKQPLWVDLSERVGQIGQHIFYNRAKDSWVALD